MKFFARHCHEVYVQRSVVQMRLTCHHSAIGHGSESGKCFFQCFIVNLRTKIADKHDEQLRARIDPAKVGVRIYTA